MVLLTDINWEIKAEDPEERYIISGVSWEEYEALLSQFGDEINKRVTYLDGVLEIMSPSYNHEFNKTNIGFFIEIYCLEKRIRYYPWGATTLRKQEKRGGLEPDESYCFGSKKKQPDLAIEVIATSGGVNKLEVYQRLGIREVWYFQNNKFTVYHLQNKTYQEMPNSLLLPDLDLSMLAEYAIFPEPLEAALAFREKIKGDS